MCIRDRPECTAKRYGADLSISSKAHGRLFVYPRCSPLCSGGLLLGQAPARLPPVSAAVAHLAFSLAPQSATWLFLFGSLRSSSHPPVTRNSETKVCVFVECSWSVRVHCCHHLSAPRVIAFRVPIALARRVTCSTTGNRRKQPIKELENFQIFSVTVY